MTQEFHLCVTHIEQDTYQLWTEHVPFAQELVSWHVSDWLVEAAHLNSGTQVQNFGQKLYSALFVGSIRNSWNIAQNLTQQNQQLRLHLKLYDRRLAQLPWKLLSTVLTMNPQIELLDDLLEDGNDSSIDSDREDAAVISDIFAQLAHSTTEENISVSAINKSASPLMRSAPPKPIDEKRLSFAFAIGTAMMLVVALGSLLWEQHQPLPQVVTTQNPQPNLQTASTAQITEIAIAQLQQQDAISAQQSLEELLNRNALQNANTALNATPQNLANTDTVLFLRGRVAWQSLHTEQAQRYWQAAVEQKPDSAKYHNALGFTYYAQGNLNQANEAWFQALYLANQSLATSDEHQNLKVDQETLTAYAGLALVLHQSAQNPAVAESVKLTNEATKLCQKVLTEAPSQFKPQHLHNNWLWDAKAIEDWRSLLSLTHKI